MGIAVITGASSGMGKEFVSQLDKINNFSEIWVIARRKEKLEELQNLTSTKIRAIPLDLTKKESIEEYKSLLESEKPEIDILVNASGFGKLQKFETTPLDKMYDMIDLNDKALIGMTYVSLPYMKSGSEIYQIGSLSAFQPVPYIGVYAATKAFVLSFSRALNVELKNRKIKVMAVCPGWVRTEFFDTAVMDDDTIVYYNKFFTDKEVVARAIRDMKKKKDVSVCGFSIRMQVLLTKLLPHKWVMKIWCKQQKK